MNGQQPNHAGGSGGYTMPPTGMMQHQYRMLPNQQGMNQPPQGQPQQQPMYPYQQGYIQNIQSHGLLNTPHQQMMIPQQQQPQAPQLQQPQQQFYANQFQQPHSQFHYSNVYQQPQHIPQRSQAEALPMHHIQNVQSAFSQPIPQQHISVSQQHYYDQPLPQPQRPRQDYSGYDPTQMHHTYQQQPLVHGVPHLQGGPIPQQQQQHVIPQLQSQRSIDSVQPKVSSHHHQQPTPMMPQQQPLPQHSQAQQVIHQPKPTKPSPAKEAENSIKHNEMIRKQRKAEEQKLQNERDQRETKRIQEEIKTRKEQDEQYAKAVNDRLQQFKYPIMFAGCHLTTNLTKILPFPRERINPDDIPIYNPIAAQEFLRPQAPDIVDYMSTLLLNSFDDVKDIQIKHNEIEANIYDGSELPPLMQSIHNHNQYSFHIQSEFDDMTLDPELAQAVAEVAAQGVGDLLQFVESDVNLPSTSQAHSQPIQQHQEPEKVIVTNPPRPVNTTGKEPKGKEKAFASSRRKRDMAEGLVDSLTPYYDVGDGRKRKRGGRDKADTSDEENQPETTGDEARLYARAKKRTEPERPPTPTEVIKQRDVEWAQRQRIREEKLRLRQQNAESQGLCVMAEGESVIKVEEKLTQIFDQVGGIEAVTPKNTSISFLIDKNILEELRQEIQKLKNWRKLHNVNGDRLAKLVFMLEKNIRDVIDEDGNLICKDLLDSDDAANEIARDLLNERFIRAANAATIILLIMTSHKAPKQAMIDDAMDRSAQLCKQLLSYVIYPAADSIVRNSKSKKSEDKANQSRKRKCPTDLFNSWVHTVYVRVVDIIECFSELIRNHHMNEVTVSQLSTIAVTPFFVDRIGEIHMASIQLLSVVFRKHHTFRHDIMRDLLLSLHQLPSAKNVKNCYRLSNQESIHNFTVLILQLIQSVVIIPVKRRTEDEDDKPTEADDATIASCFTEAKKWAAFFLKGFLHKCTAKAEEDYRKRFESFLNDLLSALYRPDWPAAELMLNMLGNILVKSFRDKSLEISLRSASLEYLGTITARLRKDRVTAVKDAANKLDKSQLDTVVRGILYDEANDPTLILEDIDTSKLSSTEKMQKLQQALIDYLIATKSDNDVSAEYAISFYAGEWYKKTAEDIVASRQRHETERQQASSSEQQKLDKRYKRILERSENMKEFLIKLADKKSLKKRSTYLAKTNNYLIEIDANWTVKYLASKKEFSQSFDAYLRAILFEVQTDGPVTMRTKAIRCLSQIIEADSDVLDLPEVVTVVQSRMMDQNVAVREAVIELVGKYLIFRPDLFDNYYAVLCDRIMDTGVAVRKRVIRIFRDYIDKVPDSPKVPEILAKIIRRVSDEEGVKKLSLDTIVAYWFTVIHEKEWLLMKVITLIDTVTYALKDKQDEYIMNFFTIVLKKNDIDKNTLHAAKQIVDTLVEYVLKLDQTLAEQQDKSLSEEDQIAFEKKHQDRLLASLTTLSMISKVRSDIMVRHAEVFLPYLKMPVRTNSEQNVLNQVINMLERVIPLIDHPAESFLRSLDEFLYLIIKEKGMVLIQSAVACLGAVCKKWTKIKSKVSTLFLQYVGFLDKVRMEMNGDIKNPIPQGKLATLKRVIFSVGLMCRFFNFDQMIDNRDDRSPSPDDTSKSELRTYPEAIYSFLHFFSSSSNREISQKSITSLGHICAEYPDFFDRVDLRKMYQVLLASEEERHLSMKTEVLKNLTLFLSVEEERTIQAREDYTRQRDAGEIQDTLKDTDKRSSTNSAIIQLFWKHVLASYLHSKDEVRIAVSHVVYQTMFQGLVTPGEPLPTMIAMTTDPVSAIRNKIEPLLKEIHTRYKGMLASKAILGMRWSYEMQRRLSKKNEKQYVIRGFRASEHCTPGTLDENGLPKNSAEAVAVLNALYVCLRGGKADQRRKFLKSVIDMFSDDSREKLSLEENLFVADNLATFPYQVFDEPLYVIRQADTILAQSCSHVLNRVKELLIPKRPGELIDEEDEFTSQNLYRRLPDDKTQIFELMKASQACFLLLYIKSYLMKLYRLTDAKVSEYSTTDKVNDKPITRQQVTIFSPELTLNELRPENIANKDTVEGHINLCDQLVSFRKMYLSLDLNNDFDEDETKIDSSDETVEPPVAKRRRITTADDNDDE